MAATTSGLLVLTLCALLCASGVRAAPKRTKVTTDQRQTGELNIHATVDNVLIVMIPSSGAEDLLALAGLKAPALLQALLNKKQKYDTEVENQNDINSEISAPGDLSQEEVVATVEEMKPQTTERATDPPRVEATEDYSPVKEQSTSGETVQETVISITTHEEPKNPVKAFPEDEVKKDIEQTKEKEDIPTESTVDITPKPDSHKTTETPKKEVVLTNDASMDEPSEKDKPKESSVKEVVSTPDARMDEPSEKDKSKESSVKEVVSTTDARMDEPSEKDKSKESSVKEVVVMTDASMDEPSEKDKSKESSVKEVVSTTDARMDEPSEKDKSKESSVKEVVVMTDASMDEASDKDKPKESSVNESQLTILDLIKPVSGKEENAEESTSSKNTVDEDKSVTLAKKIGDAVKAVDTRREKALKYQVETKWAPGLVGLLGPQERGRFAGLCAPGRWDPDLRTCLMPGETRSRAELARFLDAMRFGIAIPTK